MGKPLVSFLVSSCNKGKWLADNLWSLFNQTYDPIEIIVCDNGSTDQSIDIINSFHNRTFLKEFVPIFYKERLGISATLNKCLEKAHGELIIKLDADDICSPKHTENLVREIEEFQADMVFGDFVMEENGPGSGVNVPAVMGPILFMCTIGLSSAITKKSVFDDIGGFDEKCVFSEDWEFIIRTILSEKKVVKGSKTGYIYRVVDSEALTKKGIVGSPERLDGHSYIRKKHKLLAPCFCGCGAPGWNKDLWIPIAKVK